MFRIVTSLRTALISVGLMILLVANIPAKNKPVVGPTGHEIYMDRCGACHGEYGKGDGPAVGALGDVPADLTLLAKMNGGTFPAERLRKIVGSEEVNIVAHGSREMPIWGELFHPKNAADQQIANDRFKKLVTYLESIQE
ncbi:MAG: c-type cytochrome [Bryobacteraceae bacterium]|jgi:mono/diheme cytochrome c family protein